MGPDSVGGDLEIRRAGACTAMATDPGEEARLEEARCGSMPGKAHSLADVCKVALPCA